MTGRRCPRCPHAAHRDECPAKGPAGCVPLGDPATGRQTGIACYRGGRPPCPCPAGECHTCGAPIAGARPARGDLEIDVDNEPAACGLLAVRELPDGTWTVRMAAPGEFLQAGEWRARPHAHQLAEAAAWLAQLPV